TTATRVSSRWRASISMRMDIENSPGAPVRVLNAGARNDWGHARGATAGDDGEMRWKRVCCIRHPAAVRGKHARHRIIVAARGVLWRHASVNLVQPRTFTLAAARIPRRQAEDQTSVSIRCGWPQPRRGHFPRKSWIIYY